MNTPSVNGLLQKASHRRVSLAQMSVGRSMKSLYIIGEYVDKEVNDVKPDILML